MVCVELCTLHYQYGWDPDRVVSNAIFADGAAAAVLKSSDADQAYKDISLRATGSYLVENSKDSMSWRIGDSGFEMTLSAEVPGLIEAKLNGYLNGWLAKFGLTIKDQRLGSPSWRTAAFCEASRRRLSYPSRHWKGRVLCSQIMETCHPRRCCSSFAGLWMQVSNALG